MGAPVPFGCYTARRRSPAATVRPQERDLRTTSSGARSRDTDTVKDLDASLCQSRRSSHRRAAARSNHPDKTDAAVWRTAPLFEGGRAIPSDRPEQARTLRTWQNPRENAQRANVILLRPYNVSVEPRRDQTLIKSATSAPTPVSRPVVSEPIWSSSGQRLPRSRTIQYPA